MQSFKSIIMRNNFHDLPISVARSIMPCAAAEQHTYRYDNNPHHSLQRRERRECFSATIRSMSIVFGIFC